LNNDYVVYTHPGAYVDVNMPFFLITDLAGFVVRQQQGEEIGLRNVTMQLLDTENAVVKTVETDEDGYFEFLQLLPDAYKVVVSPDYLDKKGLTGKTVGVNIATSGRGGFVELPAFVLRRMDSNTDYDAQEFSTFIINEENTDALVWSKDEEINKNYFTLPPKGEISAKHSLSEENEVDNDSLVNADLEKNSDNLKAIEAKVKEGNEKSGIFTVSSVVEKIENSKTILPRLRVKQNQPEVIKPEKVDSPIEIIDKNETIVIESSSGWVIQFMANKAPIETIIAIDKYSAIGQLFLAKKITNKQTLNCIISRSFATKQKAMIARDKMGLKGWITTNKTYSSINQIH
jgi:hypothetical protein